MKLQQNARVVTPDARVVGEIERVVIDPNTKEVTHVVVRKGFLFTSDKVVPVSLLEGTVNDQVRLREAAGDLEQLPDYEETSYVPVGDYERTSLPEETAPPVYWNPTYPYAAMPWGVYPLGPAEPAYVRHTEQNIPEGTVALKEGARVISDDDRHVGNVEEVLTDGRTDRATHLVVSAGLLFKTRKLIPTNWIRGITADEVHLAVGEHLLEQLREYNPQPER